MLARFLFSWQLPGVESAPKCVWIKDSNQWARKFVCLEVDVCVAGEGDVATFDRLFNF